MTTTAAFNTLFKSFIEDLSRSFPEEGKLALFCESFDDLCRVNAKKPMELFVATLAPHADLVMTKNAQLFDQPLDIGIDISSLWKNEDFSDASREAVWSYLQSLFLLGTTCMNLPPELLTTIEQVAQSCAGRMQAGELDFASMMSMFSNGSGLANLAGLANMPNLAALQPPPSNK